MSKPASHLTVAKRAQSMGVNVRGHWSRARMEQEMDKVRDLTGNPFIGRGIDFDGVSEHLYEWQGRYYMSPRAIPSEAVEVEGEALRILFLETIQCLLPDYMRAQVEDHLLRRQRPRREDKHEPVSADVFFGVAS